MYCMCVQVSGCDKKILLMCSENSKQECSYIGFDSHICGVQADRIEILAISNSIRIHPK
ncbi:uncharacterized protein DS421_11g318370 [Arachis hypogaea]|nr:uncharacterized protein DS421_11g318370 [Arachis hypogaea]